MVCRRSTAVCHTNREPLCRPKRHSLPTAARGAFASSYVDASLLFTSSSCYCESRFKGNIFCDLTDRYVFSSFDILNIYKRLSLSRSQDVNERTPARALPANRQAHGTTKFRYRSARADRAT